MPARDHHSVTVHGFDACISSPIWSGIHVMSVVQDWGRERKRPNFDKIRTDSNLGEQLAWNFTCWRTACPELTWGAVFWSFNLFWLLLNLFWRTKISESKDENLRIGSVPSAQRMCTEALLWRLITPWSSSLTPWPDHPVGRSGRSVRSVVDFPFRRWREP